MQQNSTFYSKNLTTNIESAALKEKEDATPKLSVIQSLINYSKSLEFKKSNHVNQVELVLN
jgi:hypothetical protein